MAKVRTLLACSGCGQQLAQWVGRCPGCGSWGTVRERGTAASEASLATLDPAPDRERRVRTGSLGVDRMLGGGLVPSSVVLLAGEPGIGKSTLLLQLIAGLSAAGLPCLLASGEESREQVAARAARLGSEGGTVGFVSGRDLPSLLDAARAARPFLLAVDSIQTVRHPDVAGLPGGPSQVRMCADALVGLAKSEGVAVLMTGHVTKDGDLAGPRTLEHMVDVALSFGGDPRSGLRVLAGGKNRFGPEGETAWFEMGSAGLREIDPGGLLLSGQGEPGAATALPRAGRRALAVEVQALVARTDGAARRQASGLDPRRFQLVAAVVDRVGQLGLGRAELYGASSGGVRIDDPACDLAVAAALASAATGRPPPADSAFVGEVALTGLVRPASGMEARISAARAAGCKVVFAAEGLAGTGSSRRAHTTTVRHIRDALGWALERAVPDGDLAPVRRGPGEKWASDQHF